MTSNDNKVYMVQGDLAFWGYSVYGVYSTYEQAQERIKSLVNNLSELDAQELTSDLEGIYYEEENYKGLLIFSTTIDKDTYTL